MVVGVSAPDVVAVIVDRHREQAITARQAVETLADMAGISQCRAALLIVEHERARFGRGCERWAPRRFEAPEGGA